jgi:hypothetical protein
MSVAARDCSTLLRFKTGRALNAFYQANKTAVENKASVLVEQRPYSSAMVYDNRAIGKQPFIVENYTQESACCTGTTGGGPDYSTLTRSC